MIAEAEPFVLVVENELIHRTQGRQGDQGLQGVDLGKEPRRLRCARAPQSSPSTSLDALERPRFGQNRQLTERDLGSPGELADTLGRLLPLEQNEPFADGLGQAFDRTKPQAER